LKVTSTYKAHQELIKAREEIRSLENLFDNISDDELKRQYGDRLKYIMSPKELLSGLTLDQILEHINTSELVGLAAKRFTEQLLKPVQQETKPVLAQNSTTTTKKKLTKVIVIGAKNEQCNQIQRELGKKADFKFVSKDIKDVPDGGDIYVVWERFVGHDIIKEARKKAPEQGYISHFSGMSTLIPAIKERL
jgi:hypothetical protein